MQLHPLAANDPDRFAEVDLRMTRRMGQRHEHLTPAHPRPAHIVLHGRVAAGKPVLIAKPLPDALGACQRGFSTLFITAHALAHQLMEARDERRPLKLQGQLHDTAGVWLMRHMILERKPGLYLR